MTKPLRSCLALFTLLLLFQHTSAQDSEPRRPHPLAPSIPLLSQEEYAQIDRVIDRFIQADIGELKGQDAKKALQDFQALGPEAVPNLIEGLNRTARMQSSCPATIISQKLVRLVNASRDPQLLDYIRENAGIEGTVALHRNAIGNVRMACLLRKGYLQRTGLASSAPLTAQAAREPSLSELLQAAETQQGEPLKRTLIALERQQGPLVIDALGSKILSKEPDIKQMAVHLLLKHLTRQPAAVLRDSLKHTQPEVRIVAAYTIGQRKLLLGAELIALLADDNGKVQQAARQALIQLSQGRDFGPNPGASPTERAAALQSWQAWWREKMTR